MPHYLIKFTTDEPDRIIRASTLKPECRDGLGVFVAYSNSKAPVAFFTASNVLWVEETTVKRKDT